MPPPAETGLIDLRQEHPTESTRSGAGGLPEGWIRVAGVVALLAVVGAGAAERAWLLSRAMPTNSDEALATLMGRELWHGHFPMFLWGQSFGGGLEVFPVALVTKVFGSSLLAQRASTMMLGVVSAWLGVLIARRLAGRFAGWVAGAALWVWPPFFVSWGTYEYVYYVPAVALGLAALWLALRAGDADRPIWAPVLSGLAGGLAWWATPNALPFVAPVVLALVAPQGGRLRRLGLATGGAVVGCGPWLIFNLRHHFTSLNPGVLNQHASYATRLRELYRDGGPLAIGLKRAGDHSWVGPWAPSLYVVFLVGVVAVCAAGIYLWRSRRAAPPVDVAGILTYPFLYAISPAVGGLWVPRYFFYAWPWVALAAGRVFQQPLPVQAAPARAIGRRTLPARPHLAGRVPGLQSIRAASALAAVLALSAIGASQAEALPALRDSNPTASAPSPVTEALAALRAHSVTRLFCSYWDAYTLDVASGGSLIATPAWNERYRPFDNAVRSSPDPAWMIVRDSNKDRTFRAWLASQHLSASVFETGDLEVFVPARKVLPQELPVAVLWSPTEGP